MQMSHHGTARYGNVLVGLILCILTGEGPNRFVECQVGWLDLYETHPEARLDLGGRLLQLKSPRGGSTLHHRPAVGVARGPMPLPEKRILLEVNVTHAGPAVAFDLQWDRGRGAGAEGIALVPGVHLGCGFILGFGRRRLG